MQISKVEFCAGCPRLEPPQHGLVEEEGSGPGQAGRVTCQPGYTLEGGAAMLRCGLLGAWEARPAGCRGGSPVILLLHVLTPASCDVSPPAAAAARPYRGGGPPVRGHGGAQLQPGLQAGRVRPPDLSRLWRLVRPRPGLQPGVLPRPHPGARQRPQPGPAPPRPRRTVQLPGGV